MKIFYKVLLYIILVGVLPAGQTWPLKSNAVTLDYEICMVKATLDNGKNLSALNITSTEKLFWSVPAEEISDIIDPILDEVTLRYTSRIKYKSLQDMPDHVWLVIAIKIGNTKEILSEKHKDKNGFGIIYHVTDVVYFIFNNKGYHHRSRRVVNEKNNVWDLYYKDIGKKEIYDGTQEYSPVTETAPPSIPSE